MTILAIDHIQFAMPEGGEERGRAFFQGLLGIPEVPRPESLNGRPGAWFFNGSVKIHLGLETDFRPAKKAHPAFLVDDLAALEQRLKDAGHPLSYDVPLPGYIRLHTEDPFGNRIELMQKT